MKQAFYSTSLFHTRSSTPLESKELKDGILLQLEMTK